MSTTRFYRRDRHDARFYSFNIAVKETDLWIAVSTGCYDETMPERIEQLVWRERRRLEAFLSAFPGFAASLEPCVVPGTAPGIVRAMVRAGNLAGVGPMAAVAGTFAEVVGSSLQHDSTEVVVENGGDLYIKVVEELAVAIHAGNSPLSGKIALLVEPGRTPLGICTSSGTVGPSVSRGRADAAVVVSRSTPLADAAATALGNMVRSPGNLEQALELAGAIEGLKGALLICRDKMAAWGEITLCPPDSG